MPTPRAAGLMSAEAKASARRLAAILFADMVGYSRLMEEDESEAVELRSEFQAAVAPTVKEHGGEIVKTVGDGIFAAFGSAVEAVESAVEFQRTLSDRNRRKQQAQPIQVRVGIHLGDVIQEGDDLVGSGVNVASRIEPLASPEGICVSHEVYQQVRNQRGLRFHDLGERSLKNIRDPVQIYEVSEAGETPASARSRSKDRARPKAIAVLPFENMSPDPENEYFSDGVTEELILTLSKVAGLSVIARTSAMRFRGANKSVAEIGRELNVKSVLEGSVRKADSRVRITVQLIDAETEELLWSEAYDRDLEDIFAIQSDIAQRATRALQVELERWERRAIERPATKVLDAYTLYLKGRFQAAKRSEGGLRTAIAHFEEALAKDAAYAKAYSGLSDAHALMALFEMQPPHEAFPPSLAAAERALELDDRLAEAHASLGVVRFQYAWDWAGAERAFQRSLELDARYPAAHQFYADYLKAMGRFEEALTEMTRAAELDPLSLPITTGVGHVLYLSRQYDRAIEQYQKALELDPEFLQARLWFGRPYLQKGMYAEALEELQQAVELSSRSTMSLAVLGHAHAAAGNAEEAHGILKDLMKRAEERYLPSYWIALVYVGLEDRDLAFEWLDRAFQERSSWLVWCKVEPRFDVLRDDPRFDALLKKMGFPS